MSMEDTEQRTTYHKFGPAAGNEISIAAVCEGITWLFEERKQVFADMMLHIQGLDFGTTKRRG
jgi:hypothetical protein